MFIHQTLKEVIELTGLEVGRFSTNRAPSFQNSLSSCDASRRKSIM